MVDAATSCTKWVVLVTLSIFCCFSVNTRSVLAGLVISDNGNWRVIGVTLLLLFLML